MDDRTGTALPDPKPAAPDGVHEAASHSREGVSSAELAKATGMKPVGESSHELKALHGLRFLAAFCILLSHACSWLGNFDGSRAIPNFGGLFGGYGMPLFFVLSGFVIHYNYSRLFSTMRPGWAIIEFLGARFARIYPLFICFFVVGLAVDAVLLWASGHRLNLLLTFAHFLTLTQSWVYIVMYNDRLVLDGPFGLSWSLATEFFFYLSYVVLVLHLTRMNRISSVLITAAAMSAVVVAASVDAAAHWPRLQVLAGAYLNDHFGQFSEHSVYRWFFYYSPYSRVFEFILGCLTAQLYGLMAPRAVSPREASWAPIVLGVSLILLLAFDFFYVHLSGDRFSAFDVLRLNFGAAIPLAMLVFCVSRYRSSAVAVMLSTPLMLLLGDLSYSIYTVHTWTLRIFVRPTADYSLSVGLEAVLRIALGILLTIVLSTATYSLIEVPARARLRKAVARHLLWWYGPREANRLPEAQIYSYRREAAVLLAFLGMLAALALYQFVIVPKFAPYSQ